MAMQNLINTYNKRRLLIKRENCTKNLNCINCLVDFIRFDDNCVILYDVEYIEIYL